MHTSKIVNDAGVRIRSGLPALLVTAIIVCLLLALPRFFYPLLFGAATGYILQRSRFCFAGSFRDVFLIGNTTLARAVLLVLALTTVGFSLVSFLSGGISYLMATGLIHSAGWHVPIGGVLFGFGMVIAGSCVSGCLVRLGEGYIMQYYTFAGLLAGSALGAWHWGWWKQVSIDISPPVFLPHVVSWGGAVLLQLIFIALLYVLAVRLDTGGWPALKRPAWNSFPSIGKIWSAVRFRGRKSWSYTTGAVLIAVCNTLLFYFWIRPWGISSGIAHFSGWLLQTTGLNPAGWDYFVVVGQQQNITEFWEYPLIYLALAMVLGSLLATVRHNEFRWRRPRSIKYSFSALAGGVLMGYSSRMVMGCNIGGFMGGIGSLSLHGWVFGLFILLGAYLGGKMLMRYLL